MVMCGKLFASTDLAGGECYDKNGNVVESIDNVVYKEYHGMASKKARENVMSYASVEGVSGKIPYTGTTEQILVDMKLNLQASLSYAGVRDWDNFRRVVKPLEITTGSAIERQTHVL
jgi:GMP reductase